MECSLHYHLFPGQSLAEILDDHSDIITEYRAFDCVVIEAWGINTNNLKLVTDFHDKIKNVCHATLNLNNLTGEINEFATLHSIKKSLSSKNTGDWVAYAHTKGVTHPLGSAIHKKSSLLMRNINFISNVIRNNEKFREFYNVAGSDLAWANFKCFGPAQLHFAGNFWVARVDYLVKLPEISPQMITDHSSRFIAEGWIGSVDEMRPFNSFCPDRYHYDEHPHYIDGSLLEKEIQIFIGNENLWEPTQRYFEKACEYYGNKINSIVKRIYPRTFTLRKIFNDFLRRSTARFKIIGIFESFFYRVGIINSKFGLFSIYVPSQLSIYKYLAQPKRDKKELSKTRE